MDKTLEQLKAHYEPRIRPDRLGYEILDWENQESQFCRFEVLLRRVSVAGKRLLDVGCGVGDLCAYLEAKGISTDYTGVDILDRMVTEARRRCRAGLFLRADLLKEHPFAPQSFDVAFCSGIFNLETGDNQVLLEAFLRRLASLARESVVLNLLSVASPHKNRRYRYFDPEEVLALAGTYYPSAEIDQGYLANDFTLVCHTVSAG